MSAGAKKLVSRVGLAVILVSLVAGVAVALTTGEGVPTWIGMCFIAGVVVAAIPGFVKDRQ